MILPMPIYEYRCENGHHFEVIQSMSDDPVTACEECGAPVERVFHPVAVHFKGSGFYTTDYKGKSKAGSLGWDSSAGDCGWATRLRRLQGRHEVRREVAESKGSVDSSVRRQGQASSSSSD